MSPEYDRKPNLGVCRLRNTKRGVALLVCMLLALPFLTVACHNTSSSPLFPVQLEKYAKEPYPTALGRGWLALDDNCLRLKPFYFFGKGVLLIWPYGYSLETESKEIRILDNDGRVVARVGHWIKVGGGEVPLEIVEKYIGKPLSDNCTGPYWLVSGVINK